MTSSGTPFQAMNPNLRAYLMCCLCSLAAAMPARAATSHHAAHVHGQVQAQVVVDGNTLLVELQMPLDSLLGFEHRPRSAAEQQAANDALDRLKKPAAWLKPDAAALCTLKSVDVQDQALRPAVPAVAGAAESGHADLDASYQFSCAQPAQLRVVDLQLATVFKRVRRIEVQVAGARGQGGQTLVAPRSRIKLTR